MDHFTSRDDTRARALTRRGFLGDLAAGAIALGATALPLSRSSAAPNAATPAPTLPKETPLMSGAEYIALLGGPLGLYPNSDVVYGNERWREIAAGPLGNAIDLGQLIICPRCRFVSYPFSHCHVCRQWDMMESEHVGRYLEDLQEQDAPPLELIEDYLLEGWIDRAIELFDGPDTAHFFAQTLYLRDLLRSEAAASA